MRPFVNFATAFCNILLFITLLSIHCDSYSKSVNVGTRYIRKDWLHNYNSLQMWRRMLPMKGLRKSTLLVEQYLNQDDNSNIHNDVAHIDAEGDVDVTSLSQQRIKAESATRKLNPSSKIKFGDHNQPNFVQVQLNSIGIRFGDELLIKNATFTISTGDKMGLVGPNGAGKVKLRTYELRLIHFSFSIHFST